MKPSLDRGAVLCAAVLTAWSCGDVSAPPDTAVTLTQVTGHDQSGIVGQPLVEPLVVRVATADGQPVAGRSVIWSVTAGGGSVEPATSVTTADGTASTVWTLGTIVRTGRVQASVTGSEPVAFSSTSRAGAPARVEKASGDGQQTRAGHVLGQPLVVRVTDQYGNAVGGAPLSWTVAEGDAEIIARMPLAGPDGLSSATLRLGTEPTRTTATATGVVEAATFSISPLPGSFDRVDDVVGPQVHVVYVVPADGVDRRLDLDGTLERSVGSFHNWFRQASGGFAIRFDTHDGDLDVGFHRLGRTDATMKDYGAFVVTQIEQELAAAGLIEEDKLYLIYYDGGSTWACGGAAWPPHVPGRAAAMYLKGTPSGVSCGAQGFVASASDFPRYWEFAALHDLIHTMGIVSTDAPNHADLYPAHVPDRNDVMYSGPAYWIIDHTTVLDAGGDDYFGSTVPAGVPNLAHSEHLRAPAAGVIAHGPMSPLSPAEVAGLADALRRLPMHTPFTVSRQD